MKKYWKKLKPVFWTILGYGALGSALLFGDQIRRIYAKLDKATSSDVLSVDKIQPTFIYIEDPFVQEEIEAGISLSRERLKLTRFHKWLYDRIEESFIFRNLYSYKKNLPWRFLRLAQDEKQSYRTRAVRSLVSLKNLGDADYQQLAQACDLRTAIGLARSSDNFKFLLDPPHFKMKVKKKTVIADLRNFFIALDSHSNHPCLQYFISKVIIDMLEGDNKVFDDDFRVGYDNNDYILMCLEALLHHSWNDKNAKQIIDFGGLRLLMDVYKYITGPRYKKSNDALIVLSKLMANISACPGVAQSFFVSGWIKILWIMSQHKDIRISAPAQKALMNFDKDDPGQQGTMFLRRIFPLHPSQRTLSSPKVDVVFVHGLLGEVFVTWRQRDSGHCSHKSPLELLATVGKLFNLTISNRLAFAPPHPSVPKKVPSFPIPEPGLTKDENEERERLASYQTTKPLDQDFIVDVSDLNNWDKIADSYQFVLADLPIDSNVNCQGPFYGSPKQVDCSEGAFSKCWPKDWLAEDCPEIRLMGINYETNISKWMSFCPISLSSGTLDGRSKVLMETLTLAGVGKRPIIWIGHSMGGLLVKRILSLARNSTDPARRALLDQTKGIVFYSVPHKGSHLAALNTTSQMIVWPSDEVQELRQNSPSLLKLHEEFLQIVNEQPIRVITFAERESTYITSLKFELTFVDAASADADVGESYGIPLDHLCICKPAGSLPVCSFPWSKTTRYDGFSDTSGRQRGSMGHCQAHHMTTPDIMDRAAVLPEISWIT